MADTSDTAVTLPNMIRHRTTKDHASILATSITNEDLSYIHEFLVSELRMDDIKLLSLEKKEKLITLLVEFLDAPLRVEAMEMIYALLKDVGHIDALSKKLVERSADFSKLIYLKGKIDFLLYQNRDDASKAPENEYNDE